MSEAQIVAQYLLEVARKPGAKAILREGASKSWFKQNVMAPEPVKNWRGKSYGRLIYYKDYRIVRHDYKDGSVIFALYYWNPHKLFWSSKTRPGERVPDLIRRAAWEEIGNPVKLPPGANWSRYWLKIKDVLDTALYPTGKQRRTLQLQLPQPEESEL